MRIHLSLLGRTEHSAASDADARIRSERFILGVVTVPQAKRKYAMINLAGAAKRQFDPQRAHRAFVAVSLALAIFGGLTIARAIG